MYKRQGYATTGDLEPIDNFYLDPTGITFYYNVYEIAPYVMGATKITLSYEDIAHLMKVQKILMKLPKKFLTVRKIIMLYVIK